MKTVGIDLSVDVKKTGVCTIDWDRERPRCEFLSDVDDGELLDLIRTSDVAGIDVPLGWPVGFAKAVETYMEGPSGSWTTTGDDFRAENYYRLRRTDGFVKEHAEPVSPLSVSADKLGAPAMKAAWLLTQLPDSDVDRSGCEGRIVEVYPAAAIKVWELTFPAYKNKTRDVTAPAIAAAVENLAKVGGLELDFADDITTEHQLDALICALVARAARLGKTREPAAEDEKLAKVEGWIHLPEPGSLSELTSSN